MEKRHIAGILSLLVPGIGQMYNGKILKRRSLADFHWSLMDRIRWNPGYLRSPALRVVCL